ncbi:MAG: vWA domain-containing protein, partial [Acidimicrobiia bacterium]
MTRAPRLPHIVIAVAVAILTLVALVVPAHAAESDALAITTVDVSKAPEVVLTVAVDGSVATSQLDADAFTLLVSGEERAARLAGLPTDPMQVELVIDTSGSMRGQPLEAAKGAALSLVDQLPPAAQVGIVGFGGTPYDVSAATTDRAATKAAIASLQPSGETALYDAVAAVTKRLTLERRAVVLLSDGRDTASTSTLEQAVGALAAARASFYAVVLQTPESDLAAAEALATAAGGRVVHAANPRALAGVYDAIAGQLASAYQLSFRATSTGSTGMVVRLRADDQTLEAEARANIPVA